MQDIAKSLTVPEWKLPSADPCSWSGVVCNGGSVVEIVLKNKGVSGVLSPSISKLSSLKSLQLQNNQIKGDLPSLANLALLESVFLDNNAFTTIPANFFSGLTSLQTVAVHKNPFKPWSIPDDVSKCENLVEFSASNAGVTGKIPDFFSKLAGIVIGVLVGIASLAAALVCYIYRRWHRDFAWPVSAQSPANDTDLVNVNVNRNDDGRGNRRRRAQSSTATASTMDSQGMCMSIQALRAATNDFSDDAIIGKGGSAVVYKGQLMNGMMIAVKRSKGAGSSTCTKGNEQFSAEIDVLQRVRHRNLVTLLGYCDDCNEKLLVYEYMPGGTLGQHLLECATTGLPPLTWKERLAIALDVARGVEYLHSLANESFIHRDLKPSNILLGDDKRAKVSDFGLVKLAPHNQLESMRTRVAGTMGYLAPEYAC